MLFRLTGQPERKLREKPTEQGQEPTMNLTHMPCGGMVV